MSKRPETPDPRASQDRRKFLRAPLIVQRVRVTEDSRTFFGYAKNISRGGLFISATRPKEIGRRFSLEIPLPEPFDHTVRCKCEVVWRQPWSTDSTLQPGMGVKFLDLPEEEAESINRWIEESWRREKWGLRQGER